MASQPPSRCIARCHYVLNAVVIKIGVLCNFVPQVPLWKERYIVDVFIVVRVVSGDNGDITRLCPSKSDEAHCERGVGVDNVKILFLEIMVPRIKGWYGQRIVFEPRRRD